MFKRIIVAIDGSRTSQRAFQTALDLAVLHEAVLQPFYVIESGPLYMDVPGYDPSQLQAGLAEQGATLARAAGDALKARGITGSVVTADATASDDVAALILSAASTFNADLLVMGTHGRKGMQRLILGSVAERCLRQAKLPVLLIPSAAGASDAAGTP
ncbi:Universal stress protein UspA [Burkholderia sp. 8Y]|uniref:universal stress protein n=1 Tax=Burkholderia sp. 8Y TaxID=2653133 RepID=UPI0012F015E3|nr:universal stress protein [Burkholderia sp. 8Y]VXC71873.1 Universal stress protein UspA [Burkholderia sp. 8Y]